jgi:mRNA-degrading endonuclease RelE of RelBE toxin-antitoxin system
VGVADGRVGDRQGARRPAANRSGPSSSSRRREPAGSDRGAAAPHRVGRPHRLDLEGLWSARRGQYRVIYSIHDDQVLVRAVRISHRTDDYQA